MAGKNKIVSEQDRLTRENARLRGDLLTIASRVNHDLRTPLGGIVVASEMLKEILAENKPSRAPLVAPIFDSTEDIKKLIERVSFILKASVNPISKEPVKMGEVVFRVLQRLESKTLKKNADVTEPSFMAGSEWRFSVARSCVVESAGERPAIWKRPD